MFRFKIYDSYRSLGSNPVKNLPVQVARIVAESLQNNVAIAIVKLAIQDRIELIGQEFLDLERNDSLFVAHVFFKELAIVQLWLLLL